MDKDETATPPITAAFSHTLAERKTRRRLRKVWYRTQKEHWLGWLKHYNGPGHYGRMKWNRSAEFVYNHVVNPVMVLWLGEASGVVKSKVLEAKRTALTAAPTMMAQAAAIRKVIPWDAIESRLSGRFHRLAASPRQKKATL